MSYTLAYTGAEIDALLGKIDAIFVAEYGSTIYSEVTAAIAAGNKVIVANAGKVFVYAGTDDNSGYVFTQSGPNAAKPNATYVTLSTGNVWSTATVDLATLQQFYDSFMTDTASGSIASFPDGAENVPIKEMIVDIEPVQDLHSQSAPYPAGGGKNKCAPEVGTETQADVTAVVADNGITTTSGTASSTAAILVGRVNVENGVSYILSGCPASGSDTTYRLDIRSNSTTVVASDKGSGVSFTATETAEWLIAVRIYGGASAADLTFKPMVRRSTEADATFAPYSNYCPILGWTGAEIYNAPKIPQSEIIAGTISGTSSTTRCHYVPTNDYVEAGTKIRILRASSGARVGIGVYSDASHTTSVYDSGWKFTANEDTDITITVPNSGYVVFGFANQTNTSSTITPQEVAACGFVAYLSPVVEIDWTDEAGTVYGGHFVVNEDGSVDLTVQRQLITFSSSTPWTYQSAQQRFYAAISTDMVQYSARSADGISSAIKLDTASTTGDNFKGFLQGSNIYVYCTSYSDANDFKTAMVGQTILVWLKPEKYVTYHLASIVELKTLLGDNNIFADCGDVEVEYRCNTALYIEKKLGGNVQTLSTPRLIGVSPSEGAFDVISGNPINIERVPLSEIKAPELDELTEEPELEPYEEPEELEEELTEEPEAEEEPAEDAEAEEEPEAPEEVR